AEDLLGLALVVLVGGVEEVDAGVAHRLEHVRRRGLVGIAAEGHGAEAELGNLDAGTAEGFVFHRRSRKRSTALSGLVSTGQDTAWATESRARAVENCA